MNVEEEIEQMSKAIKGLTNQDLYTKNLKKVVNGKNVIFVVPPVYAEVLSQSVKGERRACVERIAKIAEVPKSWMKQETMREVQTLRNKIKMLNKLDNFISSSTSDAKQVTEIDKVIARIASF